MALQTNNLIMLGMGIQGDKPPNNEQPPLMDGIHLRWAFNPELGFPWYGFYLFRRPHRMGELRCLSEEIKKANLSVGLHPGSSLSLGTIHVDGDGDLFFTDNFPPSNVVEIENLGTFLRITLPEPACRVELSLGFQQAGTSAIIALSANTPVAQVQASGNVNNVVRATLNSDLITAVKLSASPAVLIDLCYVPVSQEANADWETVPSFPYPLCLPVTHPQYPCTPGMREQFGPAWMAMRKRIRYGNPDCSPHPLDRAGTVSAVSGSPIVVGSGTTWTAALVGATMQIGGDLNAYTIVAVLGPNRLVLSRPYGGKTQPRTSYVIRQDELAQLYDHLVTLVAGGPAAGPMANRSVPIALGAAGTVSVASGSAIVTGSGTSWDEQLVGLTFQAAHESPGTIEVRNGSPDIVGTGTNWDDSLVGMTLQVAGDPSLLIVDRVDSPTRLTLNRSYLGEDGAGKSYMLLDNAAYTIVAVTSPTSLELDRNYAEASSAGKAYRVFARFQPSESEAPAMYRQYLLDLVLLASIDPAIAQMLGLYWIDQQVIPGVAYDYLLLADYKGKAGLSAEKALALAREDDFYADGVEAYIACNKRMEPAAPLSPPDGLAVYALPGSALRPADGVFASNNAGLRWNLGITPQGALLSDRAVLYHLWRADLGSDAPPSAPAAGRYQLLTRDQPVLVAESQLPPGAVPERPPDWPPDPLHALDQGLQDGWYSYQVSGIDIFGRHSPNSAAAPWYQWSPAPEPRPWYYQDPEGSRAIHAFAIRLLDKIAPPMPTGIEAYALDPDDPTVLKDAAYDAWYKTLSDEEQKKLIGLRVRWSWLHAHMLQAPDTREFRIYYHPGPMNALLGHITSVSAASGVESIVETDIPNNEPAGAYAGADLRIGLDSFAIVASEAVSPLRLRVRSGPVITAGMVAVEHDSPIVKGAGTTWSAELAGLTFRAAGEPAEYTILQVDGAVQHLTLDRGYSGPAGAGKAYTIAGRLPQAGAPGTVAIPPVYEAGTASLTGGSPTVTGAGTNWQAKVVDKTFRVVEEPGAYRVKTVNSATELMLDRNYTGTTGAGKAYAIDHPLFVDYALPASWQQRYYVVGYDQHVAESLSPAIAPAGQELRGAAATVAGAVVSLDGTPDLSSIGLRGERLVFANNTDRPTKTYRIVAVDNVAKTVTLETAPNVGAGLLPWAIWFPLRMYEVFLPAQGDTFRESLPLTPSLAEPIAHAHIGVTAADDKPHTQDDPKWAAGRWGGRFGNEGPVGAPAGVFRVLRKLPDQPAVPAADSDRVYATAADYHSRSFYTYRWEPQDNLKAHIFRALDESIFAAELDQPARPDLEAGDDAIFPSKASEPRWDDARRRQVAREINALLAQRRSGAARADLLAGCRKLSNDALRVLAGLPGNERAFNQLTIQPLDPNDPANADRKGPDDPDSYAPKRDLRAYEDALDGRSTNRYFYRAAYLDGAHNRGALSLAGPPVYLPDVVPPRALVITKVLGGDRQITIAWASNREPDLKEYRVYRADTEEAARDLRLMKQVHVETVAAGDPVARPAEVMWTDTNLPGLVTRWYRLVAVDAADNLSEASPVVMGRTFDNFHPAPPTWKPAIPGPTPGTIGLSWISPINDLSCLVQRGPTGTGNWTNVSGWLPRSTYTYTDSSRTAGVIYDYRLRVLDSSGRQNSTFNLLTR